ncbi:MAG: hypothetical protein M0P61_17230 [Ignavibacteriaceae bacterium]|nr:hypothetical protein [Ignavibacteriaceae bacterium]
MFLTGAAAGAIAGAIMLFVAHLAPYLSAGNFVRDLDKPKLFGRAVTHREAHLLGVLMHVLLSALFGGVFALLVSYGVFAKVDFWRVAAWSLVMTVFMGGVVSPLEGHGIFGTKEDAWFPVDLLLSNLFWAVLFWGIFRMWQTITIF